MSSNKNKDTIKKEIIELLPHAPGVYRYYNSEGRVIYVGKAKDLKNRVGSYFQNYERLDTKTRLLVSKIADVQYTVVENEEDAFLLENNLIKQYQPRYNILLKDSKTYPWICIRNEDFPRVQITRQVVGDGSSYFGPYSSATYARQLLELIHNLFKLRTCNLKLRREDIEKKKFKECLYRHTKKCNAPCVGEITKEQYDTNIRAVKSILSGNVSSIIKELGARMQECSKELKFEEAQEYKEKRELLNIHYNKSVIVQPTSYSTDVFSVVTDKERAFGNYIGVSGGCIIRVLNLQLNLGRGEDSEGEVLSRFMQGVYEILGEAGISPSPDVIVPFLPTTPPGIIDERHLTIPLRGDKLQLLNLSLKNAKEFKMMSIRRELLKNREEKKNIGVEMIGRDLHMSTAPTHIECFDNSNIQGSFPVASCVVFKNGRPSKKDYRRFNIKTVIGANDFASMYEVVTRRYSRLLDEGAELPQLIVIDGGRGQLDFAYKALKDLGIERRVRIIGIAKRLEELISPGDPNPLFLDKNSPSLKLIMRLRDEAHRFGITFHRKLRSKGQINSELRDIPGVGEATEIKLLNNLKSVARIKEADIERLTAVVGKSLATKIYNYFHSK